MAYVIQAEEREIGLDLLQELAAVLRDETTGLTLADTTYRIRSARGILRLEETVQADRVCRRFQELGMRCFALEKLLELPPAEHLNVTQPQIEGDIEMALAARLEMVTERVVKTTKRGINIPMALAGLPIPTHKTQAKTVSDSDMRYALDLFTAGVRWRARPGYPLAIQELLAKVVAPQTLLGAGARGLMGREQHILTFDKEADYEKYVTWLYQVKYAGT